MIRSKISEKEIKKLIQKGGSSAAPKKEVKTTKLVQLRLPDTLLKQIDEALEETAQFGVRFSRHSFILKSIIKGLDDIRLKNT